MWEDQPCDREHWDLTHVVSAWPLGRGGVLEIEPNHMANDSVSGTYTMKPQQKLQTPAAWVSFLVGDTHRCAGRMTGPEEMEALHLGPS